jgi:small subunit ribosomal protein S15
MLTTRQKKNTIKDVKIHETDTGSAPVQIALLSRQIDELSTHLKTHRKDNHSRRGLLKMVSKRKIFLNYLAKKDKKEYDKVVKKLGLKNKAS